MRKVPAVLFGGLLLVGSVAMAQSQAASDNPFIVQGDRAELIHVMATPDRAGIDPAARGAELNAPSGAAVYRASYGAGNLIDHGGPVISTAHTFNVYMEGGSTSPYGTFGSHVDGFVQAFGTGVADYNIITQYSKSGNPIDATAPFIGSATDSTLYKTYTGDGILSDTEVKSYVAALVTGPLQSSLGSNATNTVIGLYFPKNVVSSMGSSTGCGGSNLGYCGYHSWANVSGVGHVKYAVYPWNDCSGCSLSGKGIADMQTIVTSHEIREAVTDPSDNGYAWYDRAGYEADDKCAWHNLYQMQGVYWVQPEYSNKNKGCVVP